MTEQNFRLDGWRVDVAACRMSRGSERRHLEPKVMKTLVCLAGRPGEVIPKDELIASVWGHSHVSDAALTRCIFEIRQAFGDDARKPAVVETIAKVGYRLMVQPAPDAEPARKRRLPVPWLAVASIALLSVGLWGTRGGSVPAAPATEPAVLSEVPAAITAYERGVAHYAKVDYLANANAITFFRQAVEHDPSFSLAYVRLADALTQLALRWDRERLDEAYEAATTALSLNPDNPDAYSALGVAQILRRDTVAALDTLERAYQLDPTHTKSMYNAAVAHQALFEYDEAIAMFHRVVELAPSNHEATSRLGYLYLRTGDVDAARYWLENTLEYAPESVRAWHQLATVHLVTGDVPAAIDSCRRVLDQLPEHLRCLQLTAIGYLKSGDTARSRAFFEASIARYEQAHYAKLGVAQTLIADGDEAKGLETVRAVLDEALNRIEGEHQPRNDYRLIAACYALLGDKPSALQWMDRASGVTRLFRLWDLTDPAFESLHDDRRFDRILMSSSRASDSVKL